MKKKKQQAEEELKTLSSEFRRFISRGNIIDLAVAVVIGTAFNKIVSQLVASFITPTISVLVNRINLDDWKYVISKAYVDADGTEYAEVAITYGTFITVVVDFLLTALFVFIAYKIIKAIGRRLEKARTRIHEEIHKEKIEKERLAQEEAEKEAQRLEELQKAEEAELQAQKEAELQEEKRRLAHQEELLERICASLEKRDDFRT